MRISARRLHDGIPGTAMPSFALLPPDEVEALVEYVKYLSMRGQMETALADYVFNEARAGRFARSGQRIRS